MTGTYLVKLKVLKPFHSGKARTQNAPRLDTLKGKTICEAYRAQSATRGDPFRASETFPVIRKQLQKRIPGVKIVPYSDFPSELASNEYPYWASPDKIGEILRSKGCDAVLMGNGG